MTKIWQAYARDVTYRSCSTPPLPWKGEEEEIARRYQAGATLNSLRRSHRCSYHAVIRILKDAGVESRGYTTSYLRGGSAPRFSPEEAEQIRWEHYMGAEYPDLALTYKTNKTTIGRVCRREGAYKYNGRS